MPDSRPGGIEKIAHLFIAGAGAGSLRGRDNSHLRWNSPAGDGKGRSSTGRGQVDTRQLEPDAQAADNRPSTVHPTTEVQGGEHGHADAPGAPADADMSAEPQAPRDEAAASPAASPEMAALQRVLTRARVVAVLSGHMGPLAGPAAEQFAKALAREGSQVAMLYGPADLACLHRFTGCGGAPSHDGGGSEPGDIEYSPCDALLLPDWVFQYDLWPRTRGMHAICLAYGAGSDGLMAAYGALKGLIARFGKPEEVVLLPFGCDDREQAWVRERLVEMCRRFLDIEPRSPRERVDVRIHAGRLMPIDGGCEGVRYLLDSIGQLRLTLAPGPETESKRPTEKTGARMPEKDVMPDAGPAVGTDVDQSVEITRLVPVNDMPRDGEDVLRALLEHRQDDEAGGFFDIWSRHGVAGTIQQDVGLIAAAGDTQDLLGFALWLCRQAQSGRMGDLASITIAVKDVDPWQLEAAEAMPVPVRWLTWRAFSLSEQLGLGFEPVDPQGA